MSPRLTSPSEDLARLCRDGYAVEIVHGLLLLRHVPYVGRDRQVRYGTLVSSLDLNGDITAPPSDHTVRFAGEEPCDVDGNPLEKIINSRISDEPVPGLMTGFVFSSKPRTGSYADYHAKMTAYAAILATPAQMLDRNATATPFPEQDGLVGEVDSVFNYPDTASARAGITAVSRKLTGLKIAIVGVGGTGSYILDAVAKTPVKEVHLFDGDVLQTHNAFRAPGAPSLETLCEAPFKVDYLADLYGNMHRGIVAHSTHIDADTIGVLDEMDFVFISIDKGTPKRLLIERLEHLGISFIDVGMGVKESNGSLTGQLRVTTSTTRQREHVRQRISLIDTDDEVYGSNIQISELNMINAAFAVMKWKKLYGFYHDLDDEHSSILQIDGSTLINADHPADAPGIHLVHDEPAA
ncbi:MULTISPECIES: ThiF family adenylyltransferase [unclassified Nonomuraea]|uniref:ThiF family adenylyltransferase n=1 Tax=unclassified Nonomuraea TaxID=2593643 RepID=UPI0033E38F49